MSLRKIGAGAPTIAGADSLLRFNEWRHQMSGVNNGDAETFNGFTRNLGQPPQAMGRVLSTSVNPTFQNVDNKRAFLLKSSTTQNSCIAFRPWLNGTCQMLGLRDTFGPVTGPVSTPPPSEAWATMAWLRKEAAGSTTHARFTWGFGDNTTLNPSAPVARCGLIGDGGQGFRFGSVNCPDGAAAGDNNPGDIDANFIQPNELINPGANWFHVLIRMVPPTVNQGMRWAAYLNGRLIKVFDQLANFPRGTQAVNRNFNFIEATMWHFFDAGQIPGVLVHDWRVYIEDSSQVPGS